MPHTLTNTEIYALHYTAIALRPDWHHNRPGSTWQTQLTEAGTPMQLAHATSFWHAMTALKHYAEQVKADGTPAKTTPKWYLEDGPHWTETRPTEAAEKLPPCQAHPDEGTTHVCRACRSEILTGERPHDYLGKIYNPAVGQTPQDPIMQPTHTQTPPAPAERDENRARKAAQP